MTLNTQMRMTYLQSNSNISSEKDGTDIGHESQTSYTEDELEALANGEFLGGDDSK